MSEWTPASAPGAACPDDPSGPILAREIAAVSSLAHRIAALDHALQYGPGLRVQRIVEALFLLGTFFTGDLRPAYATLALVSLQALSPRLAPVAWVAAALAPTRAARPSDLYFDLAGSRGACAASAAVLLLGIVLVHAGHPGWGFFVLTMPTASFVLSPTVGFCTGCAVYVWGRELASRLGPERRLPHGAKDVVLHRAEEAPGRPG